MALQPPLLLLQGAAWQLPTTKVSGSACEGRSETRAGLVRGAPPLRCRRTTGAPSAKTWHGQLHLHGSKVCPSCSKPPTKQLGPHTHARAGSRQQVWRSIGEPQQAGWGTAGPGAQRQCCFTTRAARQQLVLEALSSLVQHTRAGHAQQAQMG